MADDERYLDKLSDTVNNADDKFVGRFSHNIGPGGLADQGDSEVVKIETFPFTRYGAIDGTITSISSDAVQDAQGQWLYTAKVSLDKSSIMVKGEPVQLSPGMNVTVEVKTGKRRLIEFVLAPLMRAKDESVRER